uniref:hypothetical protein n=1 Tax=Parerythrobacter lutipelagi TaxID=1964208 RepID=UPI0010F88486|nr:hypothetical protein [Parerythrobacter lutipelagi]
MKTLLFSLALVGLTAVPAQACRIFRPAEHRIEALRAHEHYSGAVLVRIESARHTAEPVQDSRAWEAKIRIVRTLDGRVKMDPIIIVGGWGSAACELNPEIAKPGSLWVVYIASNGGGQEHINIALPLERAREADPALPKVR